jgi:hypothetical protein
MADGDWSINSGVFAFLEEGNPPLTPAWKHAARTTVHPEMGGGTASIHILGFDTWTLDGRIRCETADDYALVQNVNGTFADLSNGVDTWNVLAIIDLQPIAGGAGGWEGTARFQRGT